MSEKTESKIYRHIFTAEDGSKIPLTIYYKGENTKLIIIVPGMGMAAEMYSLFARVLRDMGFTVIVMELRGQGESTPIPSAAAKYGFKELFAEDISSTIKISIELFPQAKPYIIGHSLGGILSVLYATFAPHTIAGVIVLASGITYYKNYGLGGARILTAAKGVQNLIRKHGYKPKTPWENYGQQAAGVMQDWAQISLEDNWHLDDSDHDYARDLSVLAKKILAISFQGDKDMPALCTNHLLQKLPLCEIAQVFISTNPPLGHSGWLLDPWETVKYINTWIMSHPVEEGSA